MKLVERIKRINKIDVKIDEFKLCVFIFMFCGILGFFIEETYDTLYNLKLDKNGFLYGLFLPIYGWGALIFHFVSKKIKDKPMFTFLIICLFAALLEYVTGVVVFQIWNKRLWDYSSYYLNLDGHICLFSVVAFGMLGTVYVYIIEPFIKLLISKIGDNKIDLFIKCFLVIYLIDNLFSFLIKNKF